MEAAAQTEPIPHRDVTKLTVIRPNGTSTSLFIEVSGDPLPLGSFDADSAPERVRRSAGKFAAEAESFEVSQTRIPTRGPNYRG